MQKQSREPSLSRQSRLRQGSAASDLKVLQSTCAAQTLTLATFASVPLPTAVHIYTM